MKLFKKLMSYFIALTMVLSLATLLGGNVHAAEDTAQRYTLTINNTKAEHKYAVYKVFGGDLKDDGTTKTLSNVVWGNGVNASDLLEALKKDSAFTKDSSNVFANATKAADVAEILSQNYAGFDSAGAKAFAQDIGQHLGTATTTVDSSAGKTIVPLTDPGYYFVKDNSAVTGHDATTRFIVQVVGPAEVTVKSSVPTVTKKVDDKNDSTGAEETLKDSADYDIGDKVPYTITGTLPSTYADYNSYVYTFTDTMSKGLTYTASTDTQKNYKVMLYTSASDTTGTDVTNAFSEDVKAVSSEDEYNEGHKITWTCADLKANDLTKTATKDSKFVVTYKATLNGNAKVGSAGNPNKVDLTYSNNPNKRGEGETGKTPEDKNIVFTYAAKFNKVDGSNGNKPLAGARFTLYKFTTKQIDDNNDAEGTYKNVNGYWHSFGEKEASQQTDGYYTAYYKGLDDGVYKLVESHTPDGYNTMADKIFTVNATHNDGDEPSFGGLTVDDLTAKTIDDGTFTSDIQNNSGSILPSTGGMGTTLLYVAGGILVACAAAYVVLNKKRA